MADPTDMGDAQPDAYGFDFPPAHWFGADGTLAIPGAEAPSVPLTPQEESQIEIDPQPQAQAQPALEPDATTGAEVAPAPIGSVTQALGDVAEARQEGTPQQEAELGHARAYEQAETPEAADAAYRNLSPDQQKQADSADLKAYASLSTPERIIVDQKREDARDQLLRTGVTKAENDLLQQRLKDESIRTAAINSWAVKQQALAKQIADLGNQKVDERMPLGQTIMGAIASFIGGLAQPFTGRNMGAEMFDKAIDAHIQAQRENIANKRQSLQSQLGQLTQDRQGIEDDYQHAAVLRVATYDQAIKKAQEVAQNYDPRGTTVAKIYTGIAQWQAQRDKAYADLQHQSLKDEIDLETAKANIADKYASARKLGLEGDKLAGKMGAGGAAAPTGGTFGRVYQNLDEVPPKLRENTFPMPTIKGAPGGFGIAATKEQAGDATHLTQMYEQANFDLNKLQQLAIERDNAKSVGGSLLDRWKTDGEQEYDRVATDLANVYGLIIHGRAPTQGVLEEVQHAVVPKLKSFLDRGDTAEQLGKFHDEIDNRTSARLSALTGSSVQVRGERPKPVEANLNTISAPLLEKPVKGDAGYAPLNVTDFSKRLDSVLQEYKQNPGLGGSDAFKKQMDDVAGAQRAAAKEIQAEVDRLEAKKTRTPAEEQLLHNNRRALNNREFAAREAESLGKANLEALHAKEAQDKAKSVTHTKSEQDMVVEHGRNL